ncbi:MAG: NERD domain-containing protein [Mucilaginibacter sp.]|nr:NERD domain-containing protein [Mucilaginibacter sp.]
MNSTNISQVKKALRDGDITFVNRYFEQINDPEIFKIIREQKVLVNKEHFDALEKAYQSCLWRLITDAAQLADEEMYLSFLRIYLLSGEKLESQVKTKIGFLLNRNLKELLFITFTEVDRYITEVNDHFIRYINEVNDRIKTNGSRAESSEWSFNTFKGVTNDYLFAVIKLVTCFLKWRTDEINNEFIGISTRNEIEAFNGALQLCAEINSYDYALSKITYGEWRIKSVHQGSKPVFTFEIVDERLELARDISLKRMVSQKMKGRKYPLWLQLQLESVADEAVDFAWQYYEIAVSGFSAEEKASIKKEVKRTLHDIDLEDDILVIVTRDTPEIFSQYIAATALVAFVKVGKALKKLDRGYQFHFTCGEIPLPVIKEFLEQVTIDGIDCRADLASFLSGPVIKNDLELHTAPFLRDRDGTVYALDYLSEKDGQIWVRNQFMNGGTIAVRVGKAWEIYLEGLLLNSFECKVVSGVKLKRDGKLITDIDLLAIRDNLLLIIQVKSYYGYGVNHFEQWKFRKKLIHGVQQTKKAQQAIGEDHRILSRYFTNVEIEKINVIQGLVVTNAEIYNNWQCDDIPIVSTSALMQIINGATVSYITADGRNMGEDRFIAGDKISTDEFVEFIQNPLDWKLSKDNLSLHHHKEEFEDAILEFPFYENTIGANRHGIANDN